MSKKIQIVIILMLTVFGLKSISFAGDPQYYLYYDSAKSAVEKANWKSAIDNFKKVVYDDCNKSPEDSDDHDWSCDKNRPGAKRSAANPALGIGYAFLQLYNNDKDPTNLNNAYDWLMKAVRTRRGANDASFYYLIEVSLLKLKLTDSASTGARITPEDIVRLINERKARDTDLSSVPFDDGVLADKDRIFVSGLMWQKKTGLKGDSLQQAKVTQRQITQTSAFKQESGLQGIPPSVELGDNPIFIAKLQSDITEDPVGEISGSIVYPISPDVFVPIVTVRVSSSGGSSFKATVDSPVGRSRAFKAIVTIPKSAFIANTWKAPVSVDVTVEWGGASAITKRAVFRLESPNLRKDPLPEFPNKREVSEEQNSIQIPVQSDFPGFEIAWSIPGMKTPITKKFEDSDKGIVDIPVSDIVGKTVTVVVRDFWNKTVEKQFDVSVKASEVQWANLSSSYNSSKDVLWEKGTVSHSKRKISKLTIDGIVVYAGPPANQVAFDETIPLINNTQSVVVEATLEDGAKYSRNLQLSAITDNGLSPASPDGKILWTESVDTVLSQYKSTTVSSNYINARLIVKTYRLAAETAKKAAGSENELNASLRKSSAFLTQADISTKSLKQSAIPKEDTVWAMITSAQSDAVNWQDRLTKQIEAIKLATAPPTVSLTVYPGYQKFGIHIAIAKVEVTIRSGQAPSHLILNYSNGSIPDYEWDFTSPEWEKQSDTKWTVWLPVISQGGGEVTVVVYSVNLDSSGKASSPIPTQSVNKKPDGLKASSVFALLYEGNLSILEGSSTVIPPSVRASAVSGIMNEANNALSRSDFSTSDALWVEAQKINPSIKETAFGKDYLAKRNEAGNQAELASLPSSGKWNIDEIVSNLPAVQSASIATVTVNGTVNSSNPDYQLVLVVDGVDRQLTKATSSSGIYSFSSEVILNPYQGMELKLDAVSSSGLHRKNLLTGALVWNNIQADFKQITKSVSATSKIVQNQNLGILNMGVPGYIAKVSVNGSSSAMLESQSPAGTETDMSLVVQEMSLVPGKNSFVVQVSYDGGKTWPKSIQGDLVWNEIRKACEVYTEYTSLDQTKPGQWMVIYPKWTGDCSQGLKAWYLVNGQGKEILVKAEGSGGAESRASYLLMDVPPGNWRWRTEVDGQPVFSNTFSVKGEAPPSNRYALCVGINQYNDPPIPVLSGAVRDANSMYDVFISLGYKCRVITADNPIEAMQNTTGSELENQIIEFFKICRDASVVAFHYAGHGINVGGEGSGQDYLVMSDAMGVEDTAKMIPVNRIAELADKYIPSRADDFKLVLILDACRDSATGTYLDKIVCSSKTPVVLMQSVAGGEQADDTNSYTQLLVSVIKDLMKANSNGSQVNLNILDIHMAVKSKFERLPGNDSTIPDPLNNCVKMGFVPTL